MFKVYFQYYIVESYGKESYFKMLCGTDPLPTEFRAKKYKLEKHCITKVPKINIKKFKNMF